MLLTHSVPGCNNVDVKTKSIVCRQYPTDHYEGHSITKSQNYTRLSFFKILITHGTTM